MPPFTGVGSYAFKANLIDTMRNRRIADNPIARATTYYVNVSITLGDASGGPGAGTLVSPWLVDTIASLNTLIQANDADNVAWVFRSGDKFRPDPTNANISPLPAGFSMSFSTTGGTDPVEFSGYVKDQVCKAGVWTAGTNSSYSKVFTNRTVYSVRYDEMATVNLLAGTERVFKSFASATDVTGAGTTGTDCFSITTAAGTSTVTVKLSTGGDPNGLIELAMPTAVYGINATVDGVRGDNLCFYGFALDDRNGAFQNINSSVGSTGGNSFTNCSSFYTAKHAATQTNGGTAGGYVIFDNFKQGLVLRPTTGGVYIPTGLIVFYSANGSHEGYATNITSLYGGIPEKGVSSTSSQDDRYGVFPVYMHTSASDGSLLCSLVITYNSVISDGPWSCDRSSTYADPCVPMPTNSVSFTGYRGFIVNETYNGTRAFSVQMQVMGWVFINCRYTGKIDSAYAANSTMYATPSNATADRVTWCGGYVNCIFDIDWTNAADAGPALKYVFSFDTNSDMIFSHVHFNNRSGTGKQIQFQSGTHAFSGAGDMVTFNGRVANCIWATDLSAGSPDPINITRNQAMGTQTSYSLPISDNAAIPLGGINGLRVYKATTAGVADAVGMYGVNSATNYAALATIPTVGVTPSAAILGLGTASFIVPEYDMNWNRRNTTTPSFGPTDVPFAGGNVAKKLLLTLDSGEEYPQ